MIPVALPVDYTTHSRIKGQLILPSYQVKGCFMLLPGTCFQDINIDEQILLCLLLCLLKQPLNYNYKIKEGDHNFEGLKFL